MKGQQRRFNEFRTEYNHERPHEALGQQTPGSVYIPSERPFPERLPELQYPDYCEIRKVSPSGTIYWNGGQVYVSMLLARETVALEEINDGVWDIYYGQVRLGGFNQRDMKGRSVPYTTLKV